MGKTAVVLMNLGGPDSIDAIQPFLQNLFSDPDIFNIPVGQKLFAKIISKRRAPKVAAEYELIGGKSPINEITEIQRVLLEQSLRNDLPECDVFTAMRYWKPFTEEVVHLVKQNGYDTIICLPLYPHYSITTTGSSFNVWKQTFGEGSNEHIYIHSYYEDDLYTDALNARIDETLKKSFSNDAHLLFSAHGTPVSLVKKGDPYSIQIQKTVNKVMEKRGNDLPHSLSFQSKVGPVKWLTPSTEEAIRNIAEQGKKNLLVIPISFVSDHLETLYELDIEYRAVAEDVGITNYKVMTGLNDSPIFIKALHNLVMKHLHESK